MTGAAFFDLDRTLLGGSSGAVFQRTLRDQGLGPDVDIPGLSALNSLFGLAGETRMTMRLAKASSRAAKGWSTDAVRTAAEAAVPELIELVESFVAIEFARHRDAGRPIVMATSSPMQLVEPLARALEVDDVLATKWETTTGADGEVFSGGIDGRFVWARDKWLEVRDWCAAHGVDTRDSWAYSDSYYDAAMLAGVGHPCAVNPDPRLAAVATLQGWPIRSLGKPPGVVTIAGRELQEFIRPLSRPELVPNAKIQIENIEKIPSDGSAIVVANHRSYYDSTVMGMLIAKAGRSARFLGKKEVFDTPVLGQIAAAMGGIRVDRGTGSDEPLAHAIEALKAGELVMLMPQGTIPRGPAFFEPELKGRWGTAKLAAASGATVIPVGLWGTEKVWPRSQKLPSFDVTNPPTITVTVGDPVELTGEDIDADTSAIMAAISELLPPEAKVEHDPTNEELMATFPPGYSGDPNAEQDRRPGTDT